MILRGKYNGAKMSTEAVDSEYRLQNTDYRGVKMSVKNFDVENLEIYQSSYQLMLVVHKLTLNFPKIEQYGGVADQLRRSSKSITANIVEGFAKQKFYKEKFKRMLVYSLGSCDESVLWLKVAFDLGYIDEKEHQRLRNAYKILVKRISTFTSNLKT